jgi:hypothetical protein
MTTATSAKALCLHGALHWAITAWSGFLMMAPGPNTKLLLVAHQKGFLHAYALLGFGSALSMGCFPKITPGRANLCFWLLAGGAWVSFVFDTNAAFINSSLPLAAEKTGAVSDPDSLNATMLKLSATAMAIGSSLLCAGMDLSLLIGGSGGKKKN